MKNALLFLLICLGPPEVLGGQKTGSRQTALVFTHVTVIDATGAPAKPDMTVVIKGGRIAALGKTANLDVPENAQVVDATGKFLIPGLWDMHIHPWFGKNSLALFIANGITGIRVMAGEQVHHKWRQEISAGKLIGPRMVISSPVIGFRPDDFPAGSGEDAGQQVVRKVKKEDADLLKVGDFIPRDVYFNITDEAKKHGIPFAGHVPFFVSLAEASDEGQQSIEHAVYILMACSSEGEEELRKKGKETREHGDRTLERVRAGYKKMANITHCEKRAAELFARLVENSTWVCPTMTVYNEKLFVNERNIANYPRLKYVPLSTRDWWKNNVRVAAATGEGQANLKKFCEKQLAIVRAMRDAGVGLLAGTDTYLPGLDLQDELALFVQAGLSPTEALQTATYNAAKCLGKLDSMGTVEHGKFADLVLLDADPLQDIINTRRIAAVVVGGKIFDKAALQRMLARVEALEYLHRAASDGELEQVKLLISEGADVNVKNNEGLTPLHYAARKGHKEIIELYNRTAAEFAMQSNHREIVQLLVSKGADISPLHFALYMKDEAKARSLIEGGADVNRRTPYGSTPLYRAVLAGFKNIVELLIAKGADVNAKDNWNWTPLHSAVYGHKDIVELLVAEGANVNARDGANRTPLWYAKEEGNAEIVELLRKHGARE
ncbi:MAG: ankyrin repeat domain-containing protein [Planctomycetota bacterium]|jgi:imidazolonepropionase-like amidohydrolase